MTLCSVKNCKSNHRSGSSVHFFRFPLNNENLLNRWRAVVGKADWKPKKTSRICSLHFSEKDIIRGMGYKYFYLRENAVPRDYSSRVTKKEQIICSMLKSKETYTTANKSVSSSKTYVLDKSAVEDHNYSNNDSTMIENDGSNTFGTQDSNHVVQKTRLYSDKKPDVIQTDFENICTAASRSTSVSSRETCILDKSAEWDHNYSRNNVSITIENDGSGIFDTQNPNHVTQRARSQSDKKCKFILIDSKNIVMLSPISHTSTNLNSKKEIDFAAKKIQKLSTNVKNMRKKNKILQQKLRRYKKKITSMKEMLNRVQNKLTSDDSLHVIKEDFIEEDFTLQIFENKVKNEDR
ncbi:THAP domain-containing protein 5-like isoform X1 [Temnothorax curvispinosus]|uniref:THAP domain-containing protein 5-like isoform X1 n=2 Tax=Temnothorax curvispinosus TaxID=300111 RepID=A0A6J1PGR5_9HYME|nr:THAP domain-containing protein 5-like isoform X1 [Temnothorax curvispinosus]